MNETELKEQLKIRGVVFSDKFRPNVEEIAIFAKLIDLIDVLQHAPKVSNDIPLKKIKEDVLKEQAKF